MFVSASHQARALCLPPPSHLLYSSFPPSRLFLLFLVRSQLLLSCQPVPRAMTKFVLLLLLLPLLLDASASQSRDRSEYIDNWLQAGRLVSKYAWPHREPFIRWVRLLLHDENTRNRVSSGCISSLSSFVSRLSSQQEDAMLLFDSYAKVSPGFLGDRLQDFGHYSQCIKSTFEGTASRYVLLAIHWPVPEVKGKTSWTTLAMSPGQFEQLASEKTRENYTRHWIGKFNRNIDSLTMYPQLLAVCVPSTCGNSDVSGLLTQLQAHIAPLNISVYSSETLAEDSFSEYNGSKIQIVSRLTLALVILLTLVSTVLCILNPQKWKESFLGHFDAKSHTARLFSFPHSSAVRRTEFISGYKGLYLISGISNHAYMPLTPAIAFHYVPIHSLEVYDPFWNFFQKGMATFNINVTVSAMLNSISWVEQLEKSKGKTTFALFLLLRILRTLPITICVLLVMYSFPILPTGTGPLVDKAQHFMLTNCLNNGWKELLFISNFQQIKEIVSTSWPIINLPLINSTNVCACLAVLPGWLVPVRGSSVVHSFVHSTCCTGHQTKNWFCLSPLSSVNWNSV